MADWRVLSKRRALVEDGMTAFLSFGLSVGLEDPTYKYEVEHVESGRTKTIYAHDEYEVGEIISAGFDDDDD